MTEKYPFLEVRILHHADFDRSGSFGASDDQLSFAVFEAKHADHVVQIVVHEKSFQVLRVYRTSSFVVTI